MLRNLRRAISRLAASKIANAKSPPRNRYRSLILERFEARTVMTGPSPPGGGGGGGDPPAPTQLIDIDVDSDNSGTLARSQEEENIEGAFTGKVFFWNGYDKNGNSLEDWRDVPYRDASGSLTDDSSLVKGVVAVDPDDAVIVVPHKFTISVSPAENPLAVVRLYKNANKSEAFPSEHVLPDLSAQSFDFYMDGVVTGNFIITTKLYQEDFLGPDPTAWRELASDSVMVTVMDFQGIAYRPYNIWDLAVVPDSEEESPGVGIRRNGDDDDGDGKADGNVYDTNVTNDNDLLKFDFRYENGPPEWSGPPLLLDGLELRLKTTNLALKAWSSDDKGTEIPLDGLTRGSGSGPNGSSSMPAQLHFEWLEGALRTAGFDAPLWKTYSIDSEASATFTFELWDDVNEHLIKSDFVVFKPYESSVIMFDGEWQGGNPNPGPGQGYLAMARQLYTEGWDVHLFDEYDVLNSNGHDEAFAEVKSAVQRRLVTDIAMIGYSHGGGEVFNLCYDLHHYLPPSSEIRHYDVTTAIYVDVITQHTNLAETRKPLAVIEFWNHYATQWYFVMGSFVSGAELNYVYHDANHSTIDEHPLLLPRIRTQLSGGTDKF